MAQHIEPCLLAWQCKGHELQADKSTPLHAPPGGSWTSPAAPSSTSCRAAKAMPNPELNPRRTIARAAQQVLLLCGGLGGQRAQLRRALVHGHREVELAPQHLAVRDGHLRRGARAASPACGHACVSISLAILQQCTRARAYPQWRPALWHSLTEAIMNLCSTARPQPRTNDALH